MICLVGPSGIRRLLMLGAVLLTALTVSGQISAIAKHSKKDPCPSQVWRSHRSGVLHYKVGLCAPGTRWTKVDILTNQPLIDASRRPKMHGGRYGDRNWKRLTCEIRRSRMGIHCAGAFVTPDKSVKGSVFGAFRVLEACAVSTTFRAWGVPNCHTEICPASAVVLYDEVARPAGC